MDLSALSRAQVMSLPPDELALRMLRTITTGEQRTGFFFGKDRVISPDVVDREIPPAA